MQCAFCKEYIDDDSWYCDTCGEEIKTCPECKKLGKGKICTSCGKALTSAKSHAESLVHNGPTFGIATPTPPIGSTQKPFTPAGGTYHLPDAEPSKASEAAILQLRLLNKNINVDLKIDDHSIIGRTTGQYADTFSGYNQISGKHCRFNYDAVKGWTVTDLGSTNKTRYNNQEIMPNIPQPISDQSYLKIANIEFFVRIIPG